MTAIAPHLSQYPLSTAHVSIVYHPQQFTAFKQQVLAVLDQDIDLLFEYTPLPSPLNDACRYAMTGSGKRVRPLLAACAFSSVQPAQPLSHHCRRVMLAAELLHAYSLIHDDLPCMDDDDLRRGRPTCHIAFGEAAALLAGDVLQTLAFEVLSADLPNFDPADDAITLQLLSHFAPRARRMVAGQMLDLNAEGQQISQDDLEAIHRDKTGALIEAATLMGGVCAKANSEQIAALQSFATHIGLAFQVQDDILDVTASTDALGKPVGSDEKLDKSTYVKLMGVEASKTYAKSLFATANEAVVHNLGDDNALIELAQWLWHRNK